MGKNERIENLDKAKDQSSIFKLLFELYVSDLNCYLLKLPNPPGRDAADHYPVFTGSANQDLIDIITH